MGKNSDSGKGSPDYGRGVSSERLSQHSGSDNAYGGYEKVNLGDGNYTMRPTSDD